MSFIFENVLARKQLEIDASTGPSTKCRHNNIEIMPNHLLSCRRFERRRSFSKWRVAGVHANEPNPESRSKIQKNGITHEREIGICKLRLCFFHQRAPLPFFLLFLFLLLPRESVLGWGSRVSSIIYLAILRNPSTELAKYVEIKWILLQKRRSLEWNSISYSTSPSSSSLPSPSTILLNDYFKIFKTKEISF